MFLVCLFEWRFKSFQHISGYLMTFPVLLVEEDLRIVQTEKNQRLSASNSKLPQIKFSKQAGLWPTTLAVSGKSSWGATP